MAVLLFNYLNSSKKIFFYSKKYFNSHKKYFNSRKKVFFFT